MNFFKKLKLFEKRKFKQISSNYIFIFLFITYKLILERFYQQRNGGINGDHDIMEKNVNVLSHDYFLYLSTLIFTSCLVYDFGISL